MTPEVERQWREWLSGRPESVRKLAGEFPVGTHFIVGGVKYFMLGYTEDDKVIVSRTDPADDYTGAVESREYLCADHFRGVR